MQPQGSNPRKWWKGLYFGLGTLIGALITFVLMFLGILSDADKYAILCPTFLNRFIASCPKLLFEENFDDDTVEGWDIRRGTFDVIPAPDGVWRVTWDSRGNAYARHPIPEGVKNYAFEVRARLVSKSSVSKDKADGLISLHFGVNPYPSCDESFAFYMVIKSDLLRVTQYDTDCKEHSFDKIEGEYRTLFPGSWYTLRVEVRENRLITYLDDKVHSDFLLELENVSDNIAIGTCCYTDSEQHEFDIDYIKIWSLKG